MRTRKPGRVPTILWVIFILAIIAFGIDLADGYTPKTLTTFGMVIGFAGLLLVRATGKRAWQWFAIGGLMLCAGSAIYRLAVHQGWM